MARAFTVVVRYDSIANTLFSVVLFTPFDAEPWLILSRHGCISRIEVTDNIPRSKSSDVTVTSLALLLGQAPYTSTTSESTAIRFERSINSVLVALVVSYANVIAAGSVKKYLIDNSAIKGQYPLYLGLRRPDLSGRSWGATAGACRGRPTARLCCLKGYYLNKIGCSLPLIL